MYRHCTEVANAKWQIVKRILHFILNKMQLNKIFTVEIPLNAIFTHRTLFHFHFSLSMGATMHRVAPFDAQRSFVCSFGADHDKIN